MRYLCVVFFDEQKLHAMSHHESRALIDESLAYEEWLRTSGHFVVGDHLESVRTATTVRVRGRQWSVSHGPFAETSEQISGFMLIDARDLNEAIRLACNIPVIRLGGVEVRPVRERTSTISTAPAMVVGADT